MQITQASKRSAGVLVIHSFLMPRTAPVRWLSLAFFFAIPIIGILDFITGPEITFALVYLVPVASIAWLNARSAMLIAATATVITWITVDFLSGRFAPSFIAYTWNFCSRLLILEAITILLWELKRTLLETRELAQRDPLTHALNSRAFMELAQHEIFRSRRYGSPLTLVYLDVDNFKTINDTFGHHIGDTVLITIVQTMLLHTRKSDLVARLGGDEFAILLTDTGQEAAKMFITKIRAILMDVAGKRNWQVTFSIGVLTCIQMPASMEVMINIADKLMYTIKENAKNGSAFSIYADDL